MRWCAHFVLLAITFSAVTRAAPEGSTEAPAAVVAKGRALQAMLAAMRQRSGSALAEVLPLLRSLTRAQRIGLADMLRTAPPVVAAAQLATQNGSAALNTSSPAGSAGLRLDVVSVLRRGEAETRREQDEETRARAIAAVEEAANRPELFVNGTKEEELPVPEELRMHTKLTPGQLLALISANRRLSPEQLVALVGEHHRRSSGVSWRPPPTGANLASRVPPRLSNRWQQGARPPPRPSGPSGPSGPTGDELEEQCDLLGNSLCLEVADYPREQILASMKRHPLAAQAMLAPEMDLSLERRQDDAENLVDQDGGGGGAPGHAVCHTSVKYARPKRARSIVGTWKFLVNMGNEHVQTMRIEMCNSPGDACNYLANGVVSQCVQLFSHHRLMAWDKEEGLHIDIFKVPTCCSCRVQPTYGPAMFPAGQSPIQRPRRPPPQEAEPEFVDHSAPDYSQEEEEDEVVQESTFKKQRVPPAQWPAPQQWPPRRRPTKHQQPQDMSTYPPIFNKDVRKRQRVRNKNRQDSLEADLEDSAPAAAGSAPERRPVMISTDQLRGRVTTPRPTEPPPGEPTGEEGSRVNYSYHPIIDFFRNEALVQPPPAQRRADLTRRGDHVPPGPTRGVVDDWRPITPSRPLLPLNHQGV